MFEEEWGEVADSRGWCVWVRGGREAIAFMIKSEQFPEFSGGTAEGRTFLGVDIACGLLREVEELE